jgi:hypothetical protein
MEGTRMGAEAEASAVVTTYIPLASTVVVAVATVVLVWLTSKYVRLTKQMVDDMKRTREPSITVDFELVDHAVRLAVSNTGLSSAKDIKFRVKRDIDWLRVNGETGGIGELELMERGISYLAPGRTFKYHAGYPNRQRDQVGSMLLSMDVSFCNEAGATFERGIDIDMSQYQSVLFESFKDPEMAIADAIKEVERSQRSKGQSSSLVRMLTQPKRKKCPICGEKILAEARKCLHCKEWLETEGESSPAQSQPVEPEPEAENSIEPIPIPDDEGP